MRLRLFALVLFLGLPVFGDTLYTFTGSTYWTGSDNGQFVYGVRDTYSFGYNATTARIDQDLSAWPWSIYYIDFKPTTWDGQASTAMTLGMIDDDGSGEPISLAYDIFGFTGGATEFGNFTAYMEHGCIGDSIPDGCSFGWYGLPYALSVNVTDPPAVPEPASAWLFLAGIPLLLLGSRRKARSRLLH